MEEQISEEERQQRAKATSTILFCIAEGLAEGKYREFKFKVRQHRTERRDAITNRLRSAGRSRLEITFSMDIDEETFKEDVERRKAAIAEALQDEVDRSQAEQPRLIGTRPDFVIIDDPLNNTRSLTCPTCGSNDKPKLVKRGLAVRECTDEWHRGKSRPCPTCKQRSCICPPIDEVTI